MAIDLAFSNGAQYMDEMMCLKNIEALPFFIFCSSTQKNESKDRLTKTKNSIQGGKKGMQLSGTEIGISCTSLNTCTSAAREQKLSIWCSFCCRYSRIMAEEELKPSNYIPEVRYQRRGKAMKSGQLEGSSSWSRV